MTKRLQAVEVNRQTPSTVSASKRIRRDTHTKFVIVPAPNDEGDLGEGGYRLIEARDDKGEEKRHNERRRRRHGDDEDKVQKSSGTELADARRRLHAKIRLQIRQNLAKLRYKETKHLRKLYGRGVRELCSSNLRNVTTYETMEAEGDNDHV